MYPVRPEMDFPCNCPVFECKNVWNDITGVHVRYCPLCNERRESFYEPSTRWASTGRGSETEPPHIVQARTYSAVQRRQGVYVRNPKTP